MEINHFPFTGSVLGRVAQKKILSEAYETPKTIELELKKKLNVGEFVHDEIESKYCAQAQLHGTNTVKQYLKHPNIEWKYASIEIEHDVTVPTKTQMDWKVQKPIKQSVLYIFPSRSPNISRSLSTKSEW